jgi:hypothetical protein
MNLKTLSRIAVYGIAFFGIVSLCYSLAQTRDRGEWPESWSKELESLRKVARTIGFMAGNWENIYEIPFSDRYQFESLWPIILSLKTPGAPLRLSRINPGYQGSLLSYARPAVRIYAPPRNASTSPGGVEGEAMAKLNEEMVNASPEKRKELEQEFARLLRKQKEQGQILRPGPPWPKEIISDSGELPEYVRAEELDGKRRWVPAKNGFRARIEIELVTDGNIIDLNRIPLPPDTLILDKRFAK